MGKQRTAAAVIGGQVVALLLVLTYLEEGLVLEVVSNLLAQLRIGLLRISRSIELF